MNYDFGGLCEKIQTCILTNRSNQSFTVFCIVLARKGLARLQQAEQVAKAKAETQYFCGDSSDSNDGDWQD